MISCRKCYRALAAGQTANWDQQRSRGRTGVGEGGSEPQALHQGLWPRTGQAQTQGCAQTQRSLDAGMFGHKDGQLQGCLAGSVRIPSTASCTSSGSQAGMTPSPPPAPLGEAQHNSLQLCWVPRSGSWPSQKEERAHLQSTRKHQAESPLADPCHTIRKLHVSLCCWLSSALPKTAERKHSNTAKELQDLLWR